MWMLRLLAIAASKMGGAPSQEDAGVSIRADLEKHRTLMERVHFL